MLPNILALVLYAFLHVTYLHAQENDEPLALYPSRKGENVDYFIQHRDDMDDALKKGESSFRIVDTTYTNIKPAPNQGWATITVFASAPDGSEVVIKHPKRENDYCQRWFHQKEKTALGKLDRLVQFDDYLYIIVTPRIYGDSLDKWMKRAQPDDYTVLFETALAAVRLLNERGVVHDDCHAENVIIIRSDNNLVAHILDFGKVRFPNHIQYQDEYYRLLFDRDWWRFGPDMPQYEIGDKTFYPTSDRHLAHDYGLWTLEGYYMIRGRRETAVLVRDYVSNDPAEIDFEIVEQPEKQRDFDKLYVMQRNRGSTIALDEAKKLFLTRFALHDEFTYWPTYKSRMGRNKFRYPLHKNDLQRVINEGRSTFNVLHEEYAVVAAVPWMSDSVFAKGKWGENVIIKLVKGDDFEGVAKKYDQEKLILLKLKRLFQFDDERLILLMPRIFGKTLRESIIEARADDHDQLLEVGLKAMQVLEDNGIWLHEISSQNIVIDEHGVAHFYNLENAKTIVFYRDDSQMDYFRDSFEEEWSTLRAENSV